ncbi:MAG TPA: hypothetical protein VHE11_14155 [Steroidobacteraceae bacterium]|nr:hypothetical protein [Steroidobacteraceae bacterium]
MLRQPHRIALESHVYPDATLGRLVYDDLSRWHRTGHAIHRDSLV